MPKRGGERLSMPESASIPGPQVPTPSPVSVGVEKERTQEPQPGADDLETFYRYLLMPLMRELGEYRRAESEARGPVRGSEEREEMLRQKVAEWRPGQRYWGGPTGVR